MGRLAGARTRFGGAATVGGGLLLLGVAAYVFLALAGHTLPPAEYTAVASLYFVTAIVGPGLFVAVEQETNREVSGRSASGSGTGPVAGAATQVAIGAAVLVTCGLLALSPVLVERVFAGSWPMLAATVVAVWGSAAVYVLRGLYAGNRRFGWYSATLGAEGLGRLVLCLVLVLAGIVEGGAYGFAFVLGAVVAALVTAPGVRRLDLLPGPPVDRTRMAREVALLAGASGLTLLVANLAPVVVTSRLVGAVDTAAAFASLFVLARTPLFLFGPVQALILPGLSAAAARGDRAGLRRRVRSALLVVLALGAVATPVAWFAGSWAARTFFGAPVALPGIVAAALCLGTVAMMAAQVLQALLVAMRVGRAATVAWAIGTVGYVPVLFLPLAPVTAATIAQASAPVLVVALMCVAARRAARRLPVPEPTAPQPA